MRKEFIVMAAVVAVALAGYLFWQGAREEAVVQTSAPAAPAPQAAAPQTAPPAATPAPAPAAPTAATPPAQPAQQ